jgi:hypothetical protein
MHVLGGIGRKVHYSAVFGDGKNTRKGSERRDAEYAEKDRSKTPASKSAAGYPSS